ncbi:uncharacterized protein METZ01_LOCUS315837, partial [marine metagenome]
VAKSGETCCQGQGDGRGNSDNDVEGPPRGGGRHGGQDGESAKGSSPAAGAVLPDWERV